MGRLKSYITALRVRSMIRRRNMVLLLLKVRKKRSSSSVLAVYLELFLMEFIFLLSFKYYIDFNFLLHEKISTKYINNILHSQFHTSEFFFATKEFINLHIEIDIMIYINLLK